MRTPIAVAFALCSVVACSSPQVSVGRPAAPFVGTDWKLFELHELPTIGGRYQTPATFRIERRASGRGGTLGNSGRAVKWQAGKVA
jgi:hypothetical protein